MASHTGLEMRQLFPSARPTDRCLHATIDSRQDLGESVRMRLICGIINHLKTEQRTFIRSQHVAYAQTDKDD